MEHPLYDFKNYIYKKLYKKSNEILVKKYLSFNGKEHIRFKSHRNNIFM